MSKLLRLALVQLKVGKNKTENVQRAIQNIRHAVTEKGATVVALPECFNCPYGTKYFREYAEAIPHGPTCLELSKAAKELGIYLIGGSIPESEQDKLYNTCTVWSPQGDLIAKHRKMHLFDIDIPGGIRFKESESLSQGDKFTTFQIGDNFKVGIGICYDIRFEEMARIYRNSGCNMLIYPGAFNMTTGPLHWELLTRARAVDNQCYVAVVSPARDTQADYVAYGHSMAVDPWAKVITVAEADETTLIADIDTNIVDQVRQQIPVGFQRRTDKYDTKEVN